jgi:hypothetical protein
MITSNPACLEVLTAIEAGPLELSPAAEAHVRACPACSEARVHWLALEDAPPAQAPAGYFDQLPTRVLRKLPTRPRAGRHFILWALAAGLLMAVGAGGFWLGRANRQPLVEAAVTPAAMEPLPAGMPETPFMEGEDEVAQLHKLSPEEAKALLEGLVTKESKP